MTQTAIVKSIKVLKEGEKDGRKWHLRSIAFNEALQIYDQAGKQYSFLTGSTFDDEAAGVQTGDAIEFEAETTVSGSPPKTYLNLKKLRKTGQTSQPPATAPTIGKTSPLPPPEVNGAARGLACKEIGDLIRAGDKEGYKLVSKIFGDKSEAVINWYKHEILSIARIE